MCYDLVSVSGRLEFQASPPLFLLYSSVDFADALACFLFSLAHVSSSFLPSLNIALKFLFSFVLSRCQWLVSQKSFDIAKEFDITIVEDMLKAGTLQVRQVSYLVQNLPTPINTHGHTRLSARKRPPPLSDARPCFLLLSFLSHFCSYTTRTDLTTHYNRLFTTLTHGHMRGWQNMMVSAPQTIGSANYMQGIRRRRSSLLHSHDGIHAHLIDFRTVRSIYHLFPLIVYQITCVYAVCVHFCWSVRVCVRDCVCV